MIYADMNTRESFGVMRLVVENGIEKVDKSTIRAASASFRGMGKGENRTDITFRKHSTHGQARPKFRVWIQNSAPREKL